MSIKNLTVVSGEKPSKVFTDTDTGRTYLGYPASKDTSVSDAGWAIRVILFSNNEYDLDLWANGTKSKVHVWDDKADYDYERV